MDQREEPVGMADERMELVFDERDEPVSDWWMKKVMNQMEDDQWMKHVTDQRATQACLN